MNVFNCDRTCPMFELVDICKFTPLLSRIGVFGVNSHTVRIKCEMTDHAVLALAVLAMGGKMVGLGSHRIFEYGNDSVGMAFMLPNWRKHLVLQDDGELAFDDYKGAWGNVAELDKLKAEYTLAKATLAAEALGWQCERVGDSLTVYHPNGGTLNVSATGAEAVGFHGVGCHEALMSLGVTGEYTPTKEYGESQSEAQCGE